MSSSRPKLTGCLAERIKDKQENVEELAKKKDYVGAAAAQAELDALEKRLSEIVSSSQPKPTDHLAEQIKKLRENTEKLAAEKDYVGAAAAQVMLDALENRLFSTPAVDQVFPEYHERVKELQANAEALANRRDFKRGRSSANRGESIGGAEETD